MTCRATQKEDDAQDVKDENKSTSSLIAILPLMTRSTTQATDDVSGVSIVHYVLAAKETKPSDAMNPEMRINAINKEVRGLINRRAFSLVHVYAVPSHANIIGTRNITRLKHIDTIDEEAKARLTIQGFKDAGKNRIVSNAPTVSHASIRILISFAAIKVYPVWTKDTTHAFLQRKNTFSCDLYAMLPLELRSVFKGYVLQASRLWTALRQRTGFVIAKMIFIFSIDATQSHGYILLRASYFGDRSRNNSDGDRSRNNSDGNRSRNNSDGDRSRNNSDGDISRVVKITEIILALKTTKLY
jgi:hypothetical protein